MVHIQNRTDLMEYIEANFDMQAVITAMVTGITEHLGMFNDCPHPGSAGFIVRVTSQHGPQWTVIVHHTKGTKTRHIGLMREVPWINWIGWYAFGQLYEGDDFNKNMELHLQEFDDAEIQIKRLHQNRGRAESNIEYNFDNPESGNNL